MTMSYLLPVIVACVLYPSPLSLSVSLSLLLITVLPYENYPRTTTLYNPLSLPDVIG